MTEENDESFLFEAKLEKGIRLNRLPRRSNRLGKYWGKRMAPFNHIMLAARDGDSILVPKRYRGMFHKAALTHDKAVVTQKEPNDMIRIWIFDNTTFDKLKL